MSVNENILEETKLATTPVNGFNDGDWREFWGIRYNEKLKSVQQNPEKVQIVFLGDSITHFWETNGIQTYRRHFGAYNILNLGFSGDRTQQMLWIINTGTIFNAVQPKLIVMMIGTNNFGWDESGTEATAEGIKLCLESLRKRCPNSKILFYGIFPRGEKPDDKGRLLAADINRKICHFSDNKVIFYEDITEKLVQPDGTLSVSVFGDFLHPCEPGYEIWAQSIMPYVRRYVDSEK